MKTRLGQNIAKSVIIFVLGGLIVSSCSTIETTPPLRGTVSSYMDDWDSAETEDEKRDVFASLLIEYSLLHEELEVMESKDD